MLHTLLISVVTLGGVTLLLATLLVLANRKLFVFEDPRIEAVEDMLPHANCGGCGFPSCHAFAEALVGGQVLPGRCSVSSDAQHTVIADYLKVDVGSELKRVARLACAGGNQVAVNKAHYIGPQGCVAAAQVGGGNKACHWGCLGFGDCAVACTFHAIEMNSHGLPVVDEDKCTACGDCVAICPKDLFSLQAISHQLWVACKNQEQGDEILADCQVGCTACGRCAMDAKDQHIAMQHNLPVIDYQKSTDGAEAIERCPTGAIVWWEGGEIRKGHEAKRLWRQQPLPESPT